MPVLSALARLSHALILFLLVALPVALAGCGLPGATLGNDPCLLQSYQGHSNGNIGGMNGAYSTLTGKLDALQGPAYTISASGDISETLQAIAVFQRTLEKQTAYLNHSTPPPPSEAAPFLGHMRAAIQPFNTGSYLLAQAYLDAHTNHLRAAQDIAVEARGYMRRGSYLLVQASGDLANLHTDNVNC